MPTALVTGATGAIGPVLVNHLLDHGYVVRTYSLDPPSPGLFTGDGVSTWGDITDADALAAALSGVDVVFHLAALLHIEQPGPELKPLYRRVNVEGTRIVAEQAAREGVRRMIYFSTVKVYGVRQREPVTEDHPPHPRTFYSQTKLGGEEAVRAVKGLDSTVLRLSTVYGPRLKGSWNRLVHAIQRGMFAPVGSLNNVHSLTHVHDVAQAAHIAAEHPEAVGGVYNVVGHEAPTLRAIVTAIYGACGKRLPPVRIPGGVALGGAFVLNQCLGRRAPLTPEMVRQFIADEAYSNGKLAALGFSASITLSEGWDHTIYAQWQGGPDANRSQV